VIRAFVVDDEPLAVKRLVRLLEETGRAEIAGSSTDPVDALAALGNSDVDVLFLDIQMPGMNGFELLTLLDPQPMVVFTTAYDQFALEAFQVNSIDYLLKPIEASHLSRALDKAERLRRVPEPLPDLKALLEQLRGAAAPAWPERIASRSGERIHILDLATVTHFFAEDKLTFAAAAGKNHVVDQTITELEGKLDPRRFFRIHRSTLVNLAWVRELDQWFAGRMRLRLKDAKATELTVARDRVAELKKRLGAA
jgi:two-component system LytT family response regulator